MNESTKTPGFLAVDFYCGAGGTTRGLLDAGGYVICGIDKDEANRTSYRDNNRNTTLDGDKPKYLAFDMFPSGPDYPSGQQQEVWSELRTLIPYFRTEAPNTPLLFAICAPCQSFTQFTQRRMTDDRIESRERDLDLLSQTMDFIREFRPELIISENVASIRTGRHSHIWSDFERNLYDLGYAVGENRVCASRFGVPQNRWRSVLLAIHDESQRHLAPDLQVPTADPEASRLTVRGAIGHLPVLEAGEESDDVPNHVCRNLTDVNRRRLESVEPGEPNWGFAETPFGDLSLPCHRRLAAKGKQGFGDVYTRMHPDRPAPTLTTRFHSISNGRFGHYDAEQVRGLSLREGAVLQSFGEEYVFHGESMDAIARMIGNAVPPKLSAYMATWLVGLWRDRSEVVSGR